MSSRSIKVFGRYTENIDVMGCFYWESNEIFTKEGEVRFIDGELCYLAWSSFWTRAWVPIKNDEKRGNK